jgi:hypothetical protein
MNLLTLLNRTLALGSWGIMTLYHMAFRLLPGLLFLFFPDQAARQFLVPEAIGTSIPLPLIPHVSRSIGILLISIGLLFGFFGSVVDLKARKRLTYFAVLSSFCGLLFCSVEIYLKSGLIRTEILVAGILAHTIGLTLCGICLFFFYNPSNGKTKKKKN